MSQPTSLSKIAAIAGAMLFVCLFAWKAANPHYTIPTPAMDRTVRVGDVVMASRMAYGLRIPFTNYRLPATRAVQRGDLVVLHFPAGDTVLLGSEYRSYYDLVREAAFNGQPLAGTIETRSVSDRMVYLERCVALAGDKVEIRNGTLYVNDQQEKEPSHAMKAWSITLKAAPTEASIQYIMDTYRAEFMLQRGGPLTYAVRMTREDALRLQSDASVTKVEPFSYPAGEQMMPVANIYPNDLTHYHWNIDNMGPIQVPKKGDVLTLNDSTLALYSRIIGTYEGNKLQTRDGKIYINDKEATQYTCRQNYYWTMGDSRHNSYDSRFWGFLPEDHLEARAWLTLWSWDSDAKKLRSERTMTDME